MTEHRWITGETSRELRETYVREALLPLARAAFAHDAELASIVLAVSQYFCDEAEDAVHTYLLPSPMADPTWPDCFDHNPFLEPDGQGFELSARGMAVCGYEQETRYPGLDENSTSITAFASYCPEMMEQDMPPREAYTPYAIVRRAPGNEALIEVVGIMMRPEWEDRFDVGFDEDDDGFEGSGTRPTGPPTSSPGSAAGKNVMEQRARGERGGFLAWLRRLFGGR